MLNSIGQTQVPLRKPAFSAFDPKTLEEAKAGKTDAILKIIYDPEGIETPKDVLSYEDVGKQYMATFSNNNPVGAAKTCADSLSGRAKELSSRANELYTFANKLSVLAKACERSARIFSANYKLPNGPDIGVYNHTGPYEKQ